VEEYDLERSDFTNDYDDEEDDYEEEEEEYEYEEHRPVTPMLPERPASTLLKVFQSKAKIFATTAIVLWIHDILVRNRGSVPLTYGSGLLFLSVAFKMTTKYKGGASSLPAMNM
jgi:hypothetical protein